MVKGSTHATKTRERIQSSMLINALSDHALGKNDMSATQVRAAEILLRKSIPDLQAVDHTSGGESVTVILGSFVEPSGA